MHRGFVIFLGSLFVTVAASAQLPVDYSVYFDPQPAVANGQQVPVTPIRTTANGKIIERVYGVMYDVGTGPGTHTYKYTLRAYGPNSTNTACEVSTIVQPFGPIYARKKIAMFEAIYPGSHLGVVPKSPPSAATGRYSLWVFGEEQLAGQPRQDTSTGNNVYPPVDGGCCKLLVDVRPNVESIRCVAVGWPGIELLKPGGKVPH
jgi:hypothetical protein